MPTTAAALGMVRAGVSAVFLSSVLTTSFSSLGNLPVTIFRPLGLMQLLSWRFYDRLITPQGMTALKWIMVVSLTMSTIGYLTPVSTKTSALLVLFYEGILRSFGHFNHDEMLGVYFLVVLAFSPCGDGFSVDSLPVRKANRGEFAYGYPILLMRLLLAWTYFSAALIKLRVAGLRYFAADNLPALAISHSLDNLHDTRFRLAFWLPTVREYAPFVVSLVLIWELLFPLAVFWKRARWWLLGMGVIFHLSTLFLMNIFFPYQLAMYLVFVDWPRFATWLANTRIFHRASSWWRDFRSVPEHFPGVRAHGITDKGLLVWDGECGFCASSVRLLRRLIRQPFSDRSYQSIRDKLPPEVVEWSQRQAHWIDAQGRVTGGSAAIVELLATSGHVFLAGLLSTCSLRPFVWLGYRLVAVNRGRLKRFS